MCLQQACHWQSTWMLPSLIAILHWGVDPTSTKKTPPIQGSVQWHLLLYLFSKVSTSIFLSFSIMFWPPSFSLNPLKVAMGTLMGKYLCMLQHPSLWNIDAVGQFFFFVFNYSNGFDMDFKKKEMELIWWYICFTDWNDPALEHVEIITIAESNASFEGDRNTCFA